MCPIIDVWPGQTPQIRRLNRLFRGVCDEAQGLRRLRCQAQEERVRERREAEAEVHVVRRFVRRQVQHRQGRSRGLPGMAAGQRSHAPGARCGGPMPRRNNHSESTNRQLGDLVRNHRGMPLDHRIKAVYWWCYMHMEHPLPPDLMLERMPTDDDIDVLRAAYGPKARGREPVEWDAGLTWSEFHHSTPYPYSVD